MSFQSSLSPCTSFFSRVYRVTTLAGLFGLAWVSSAALGLEDKTFFRDLVSQNFKTTPYTALIINKSFEPVNDIRTDLGFTGYVRYRFYADVLETYKGEALGQVTYTATYEAGIAPRIPGKPQLISLCHSDKGYYYPDNGYLLDATKDLKATLVELQKNTLNEPASKDFGESSACR